MSTAVREACSAIEPWVAFWRRRWLLLSVVFALIAVASIVLAIRDIAHRPWVSTSQLFVAVRPVSGASGTSVVSFEAESRQIAIDLSQVIAGRAMDAAVSSDLAHRPTSDTVRTDLSASADNRVVTISAASTTATNARGIDSAADQELLINRQAFVGTFVASRTELSVIGSPTVARQTISRILLMLLIRLCVAAIVAVAVAAGFDYLLPRSA